jgi:hypothetical protein
MKKHKLPIYTLCPVFLLLSLNCICQDINSGAFINSQDLEFLEQLTASVMESSRIYPGQKAVDYFGPNNTGGTLIRPGGRDAYPSFWIRDYAMSLESGLVKPQEQKHMLLLTASTQCDQTWITQGGSMIPYGAIADHIRIDDSLPIFYPGTYSYEEQGVAKFGKMPPYSDQFFFIHMAWYYVMHTGEEGILSRIINGRSLLNRLQTAFHVLPEGENSLVFTTEEFRGVDFGFRDVQVITGYLCYPSILKYRAARQLADLLEQSGFTEKATIYRQTAETIKKAIPEVFMDEKGMLRASTGKSSQGDVWATALAVYLEAIDAGCRKKAGQALTNAYQQGTLSYKGNIRHVLTTDDYNDETAWEVSLSKKNTYQNGSYWGTPTGWVCYAIAQVNIEAARQLAKEYITDLRETDYRQGDDFGGPYECFHPESGDLRNPVYLTTVSCSYAVFKEHLPDRP